MMVMKESVRVEITIGKQSLATVRFMTAKNGEETTVVDTVVSTPDYASAMILLLATADLLTGSGVGQVVMAAYSACKVQLMKQQNENGKLITTEGDDFPF